MPKYTVEELVKQDPLLGQRIIRYSLLANKIVLVFESGATLEFMSPFTVTVPDIPSVVE